MPLAQAPTGFCGPARNSIYFFFAIHFCIIIVELFTARTKSGVSMLPMRLRYPI